MSWSIKELICGNKFLGYAFSSSGGNFSASYCGALQEQVVSSKINNNGKPYITVKSTKDILEMADAEGYVSSGADAGSTQCVALVKAVVPALGSTKDSNYKARWARGDRVTDETAPKLPSGAVIGYGFDSAGYYQSNTSGNHVAIFLSYSKGKLTVLDQWTGHPASQRETPLKNKDWYVVTVKPQKNA